MNTRRSIDPQRLAALMDGRLGQAAAEQLRSEIAELDDDTISAYADAVAVSAELGLLEPSNQNTSTSVWSLNAARMKRHWLAVTASVAVAASLAIFVWNQRAESTSTDLSLYASAIPGNSAAASPPWDQIRGTAQNSTQRKRAVRAGVLVTDIVHNRINGLDDAMLVQELVSLLEIVPSGAAPALQVRAWAASSANTTSSAQLPQLSRYVLAAVDQDLAQLGAFLEAQRLSSSTNGASTSENPATILEAIPKAQLSKSEQDELRELARMLRADRTNLDSVRTATERIIRTLTQ